MKYQLTNLDIEKVDFDESTTIFRVTCSLQDADTYKTIDKLCFEFTPLQLQTLNKKVGIDIPSLVSEGIVGKAVNEIYDLSYCDSIINNKDCGPIYNYTYWETIKKELVNDNKDFIRKIEDEIIKIVKEESPDYIIPRDYDSMKYKSDQYNKISKFLDDENVPKGDDKNGDYNLLKRIGILFHKDVTTNGIQDAKLDYNTGDVILIVDDYGHFTPILITGVCYSGLGKIATHKWLCYETYIDGKEVHIPYDSNKIVGYVGNVKDLMKEYKDNCYWKEPEDKEIE